jgi:hypothetical protein
LAEGIEVSVVETTRTLQLKYHANALRIAQIIREVVTNGVRKLSYKREKGKGKREKATGKAERCE